MGSFLEFKWNVDPPPVVLPDMPAKLFQKLDFTKRGVSYDDGDNTGGTLKSQRGEVLDTLLGRYGKEWEEAWPGTMQAVQQVQRGR